MALLHLKLDVEPMVRTFYTYRYGDRWENFAAVSSKGPASAATLHQRDIPMGMVLLVAGHAAGCAHAHGGHAHPPRLRHPDTDYPHARPLRRPPGARRLQRRRVLHYLTDGSLPAHTTEKSAWRTQDVIIIGGGIWRGRRGVRLARRGVAVTLVEGRTRQHGLRLDAGRRAPVRAATRPSCRWPE